MNTYNALEDGMVIRDLLERDVPHVHAIYAHDVATNTASWEYTPPSLRDFEVRLHNIVRSGFPFLVAVMDDEIAGYAYASHYRTREGYRFTVENSVYVHHRHKGKHIGANLMCELIQRCTHLGFKQMIAVIGDSENVASIRLHEKLGFVHIGTLPSIGFKFDRWLDSIMMQRSL